MQNLLGFSRDTRFEAFVARLSESNMINGCLIEYHPDWLSTWIIRQTLGDGALEYSYDRLFDPFSRSFRWGLYDVILNDIATATQDPDPDWLPPQPLWDIIVGMTGKLFSESAVKSEKIPPFIVKVLVDPVNPAADIQARGAHRLERQRILTIAQSAPFMVVVLNRPRAELQSAVVTTSPALKGGYELAHTSKGTLGGILCNKSDGRKYLLTCAHVTLGQKLTAITPGGTVALDPPAHESELMDNPVPGCSPKHPKCVTNDVDVALIDVTSENWTNEIEGLGTVTAIHYLASLSVNNSVYSHGAGTGKIRSWAMHGFSVWREFVVNGVNYCYRDLIHYNSQSTLPVAAPIARALSYVPQNGDSGAWLCRRLGSSQNAFCGMHIGSDGVNGYAITADAIKVWAALPSIDLELETF